ncbi:mannose-P-dolichol utilization defect 1 protein homolog [Agrilus planipennis]|uniref:Solute carrier family 66 member 3 n=1 Tax=Agrilus planipennis TaxID=224129 RepID=A0A1W4WLJ0_AGRPL|nr:mannose-P-dolichol utilization defect 1 protein homolog [Agrilus planipennis]
MTLKYETSILQSISNFLSIITIFSCFILKIPQIINILRVKNAHGISLIGLCMELFSYTTMFSYNFRNHYAILTYLEYPIILIQELILITITFYYKNFFNIGFFAGASIYCSMAFGMLYGIIPREFLTFLVPLCTPIGASSKVIQLLEILRSGTAESVSILTWFLSAFTNATRIFTILMDSSDMVLLLNFSINTMLSASIMITAYFFKAKNIHKMHTE